MLKGRGRDPRGMPSPTPARLTMQPTMLGVARPPTQMSQRAPLTRPEPDYEVVEFPGEQYVNAKLQPPPPPPPRPSTGHPPDAGASCGLCGGGGARVRCAECGRRALCASCDDMYHRHPKRRNHQRQALSQSQLRDERPPLPPKVAPPVPPPRRHKIGGDRMSASPKPPTMDHRRATLGHMGVMLGPHSQQSVAPTNLMTPQHVHQHIPLHLQTKITSTPTPNHVGSMPYLPTNIQHATAPIAPTQGQTNTLGPISVAWNRPRGSLHGFGLHPNMAAPTESWESADNTSHSMQSWNRPLRRGASVLELGGAVGAGGATGGCSGCAWRYGSCASLDHAWPGAGAWPPAVCCAPPHAPPAAHMYPHPHVHPPQTPQPYRKADSRAASRAGSRAASRAASPAMSTRSRTSRRARHRTPSPPPLPSSDADSESESDSDHDPPAEPQDQGEHDSLGPAPPPPSTTWQCEHCTFVNEPGVRVCIVCCRTPTTTAKTIATDINEKIERLNINRKEIRSPERIADRPRVERNGEKCSLKSKKERTSTGCGPTPPRDGIKSRKPENRLVTPTREQNNEKLRERHDMAVGPSPPRESEIKKHAARDIDTEISPPRDANRTVRVSPYRDAGQSPKPEPPKRHSISVGPSPPRENDRKTIGTSPNNANVQKKSTGTSPPRETIIESRASIKSSKTSNTGTSPPPQSISTQTYEVPNTWERAPSVSRSRARRRFRDDSRRERSHSRHSLSSDTRESDRSVRTTGPGGRWEWRERDSSPGGDWGDNYSRLSRRASHLDLRRTRVNRRSSFYGSEAASPERQGAGRAVSLEALAGAGAAREAERGIELARLMSEAERLGFSAAEVQAALAQSPAAPLAWLRSRWPSLCAGVRAAAARLAPRAAVSELEARAALARHRGAMWPAVTDCVERHRRQEAPGAGEEGRMRGRVWGSPAGADDEAAPPLSPSRRSHRARAEDSSDEFEAPTPGKFRNDDWMYLPLDVEIDDRYEPERIVTWKGPSYVEVPDDADDIVRQLKKVLKRAGAPSLDENLLLKGLLSGDATLEPEINNGTDNIKSHMSDLLQTENDFIDAYNALTKSSPLPNLNKPINNATTDKKNALHNGTTTQTKEIDDAQVQQQNVEIINAIATEDYPQSDELSYRQISYSRTQQLDKEKDDTTPVVTEVEPNSLNSVFTHENYMQLSTTSSNTKKIVHSEGNTAEQNSQKQMEEKGKNLNDIVDNTQKLIQQMKEEINSDINSIDGRTMSHSEPETSSNDEQESSYSDTDDRTSEGTTSDEKEVTTSEDENEDDLQSEKPPTLLQHRTSSEDNETFEEALDHVESQLEDFKNANIEMLDSIARSLQEEHTVTIEINKPKLQTLKEDVNNNLFTAVNTFEEIYDQLHGKPNSSNKTQNDISIGNEENIDLFAKHIINISVLKTVAPTKLMVFETVQPILNATLENFDNEHEDGKDVQEIVVNMALDIAHSQTDTETTTETISETEHEKQSNTETTRDALLGTEHIINNEDNISSRSASPEPVVDFKPDDKSNIMPNRSKSLSPIISQQGNEHIENKEGSNKDIPQENSIITLEENENANKDEPSSPLINGNRHTNIPTKVTNDINNVKVTSNMKSNIPKLIKPTNTKTKVDKNVAKFVVSKVPVRRASIKQYPAPAPPKSHFGNIQSGHVKQLQTRLFNNKDGSSVSGSIPTETIEEKASTSTLNKKKPAPPPPSKLQEKKQVSPPKITTQPKEKKQYFRETCRTEDEWTESDSEDSQIQVIKPNEELTYAPPSPPPPITVRRVSGQIIDLASVRVPEGSPERQARMLLAEGATETWEQAQIAVELISRGADPPAALLAALECADLPSALAYLYQDCELCASRLPEHEMVSMLRCTHRCCRECAHHYFTVQITERSIADCVCPYCKLPELESLPEDAWLEYFAHLDILLKTLLETDVHELFQRKLRDRTLARDPNFRWCMECSSGFFVHPKQKKIRCPECRSVSCASCRKAWTTNHEGLTCEQYTAWLEDNDPERSVTAIQQHLKDNGLECPRCHFKYSLSRGGCMHFTCTQCKYEFCYGCGKPFTMGARCGLSDYCAKLGLHAHHPRNCLFYLRDKEPHELQTLLQMNNVTYETQASEGSTGRCPVQLQRESPTGLVDCMCGHEAPANYAGLCKVHYVEYLAGLARSLDPIPIMDVTDLVAELRRRALPLPERGPWDTDPIYAGMCAEIVREKIPLD